MKVWCRTSLMAGDSTTRLHGPTLPLSAQTLHLAVTRNTLSQVVLAPGAALGCGPGDLRLGKQKCSPTAVHTPPSFPRLRSASPLKVPRRLTKAAMQSAGEGRSHTVASVASTGSQPTRAGSSHAKRHLLLVGNSTAALVTRSL